MFRKNHFINILRFVVFDTWVDKVSTVLQAEVRFFIFHVALMLYSLSALTHNICSYLLSICFTVKHRPCWEYSVPASASIVSPRGRGTNYLLTRALGPHRVPASHACFTVPAIPFRYAIKSVVRAPMTAAGARATLTTPTTSALLARIYSGCVVAAFTLLVV